MSKIIVNFFLAACFIFIGIMIDQLAVKKKQGLIETSMANNCDQDKSLREKLSAVSVEQINMYLQSQNADEKLKKADEILTQIIQIFIADLGFKVKNNKTESLNLKESSPLKTGIKTTDQSEKSSSNLEPKVGRTQESKKKYLVEILNETNPSQALNYMSALVSDNFSQNIHDATSLNDEQLVQLKGKFEGIIVYDATPENVARVEFEFDGARIAESVKGKFRFVIFNQQGKATSTSSGEGNLEESISNFDSSFLVKSGSAYAEFYYFPQLDQFYGNYYENKKGQYKKTGYIRLNRK